MTTEERSGVEGVEGVGRAGGQAAAAGPVGTSERICPDCHTYMCGSATRDEDRCQAAIISALHAALAATERRAEKAALALARAHDVIAMQRNEIDPEKYSEIDAAAHEVLDPCDEMADKLDRALADLDLAQKALRASETNRETAERELVSMTTDRDSWVEQADQRAAEAVEYLQRATAAESRLSRAVEALRFYGQKMNHTDGSVMADAGDRARAVLAEVGK